MKLHPFITIQICAITDDNESVTYFMGTSEWNKVRITDEYSPTSEKEMVKRFRELLKYSRES